MGWVDGGQRSGWFVHMRWRCSHSPFQTGGTIEMMVYYLTIILWKGDGYRGCEVETVDKLDKFKYTRGIIIFFPALISAHGSYADLHRIIIIDVTYPHFFHQPLASDEFFKAHRSENFHNERISRFSGSFLADSSPGILSKHNIKETASQHNIWGIFYIPKGDGSEGDQRRRKMIMSWKRRLS